MKLIDADELMEIINYTFSKPPFSRKTIKHMIDMARTVDAVPVRHAKLLNAYPYGECSNCGYLIDIREEFKYCPNCGARMDEERKEHE